MPETEHQLTVEDVRPTLEDVNHGLSILGIGVLVCGCIIAANAFYDVSIALSLGFGLFSGVWSLLVMVLLIRYMLPHMFLALYRHTTLLDGDSE